MMFPITQQVHGPIAWAKRRISAISNYFAFDRTLATFNAGMAKRAGQGPFAAAPIVQGALNGTGTADVININRGDEIVDYFYANIDEYQGTISGWITCEWDGDDGISHLFVGTYNTGWHLIKIGSTLHLRHSNTNIVQVDISGWIAGTTYNIVARWDTKNTLDGTNYGCISVNDSHTFGYTSAITAGAAGNIYVGSSNGTYPANAIIEGLTIYRRVLFDGTYGTDVGNGDEIAQTYNAGAGKDPTEITGSWDVVFCLPTDATPGELVTGEGNAWSHPHSSAVLGDTWMSQGGTPGPWAVEFDGTSTGVNCGSDSSIDDLPSGGAFTAEAWIRQNNTTSNDWFLGKHSVGAGWFIGIASGSRLTAYLYCDTTDITYAVASIGVTFTEWTHFAITYDETGDRKIRIFIDGVLKATTAASVGSYTSDASDDLKIGLLSGQSGWNPWDGDIAWVRISDSIRYTDDFVPPVQCPATDGNTVALYAMDEGTGTSLADSSANTNTGTISNGSWSPVWAEEGTPSTGPEDITPSERVYNWGYQWTADATDEGITQQKTGLDAGQSYVARVLAHTDEFSGANDHITLQAWDDTNDAEITSFDFGADSSADVPSVALITWELPTTARNGSAADCTAMSVRVLANTAGATVYLHQCEVQENLIDNPSMETGSGDPWIPDGWGNNAIDAGETVQELTELHSGSSAIEFVAGISLPEGIRFTIDLGSGGEFVAMGSWVKPNGSEAMRVTGSASVDRGSSNAGVPGGEVYPTGSLWQHIPMVMRQTGPIGMANLIGANEVFTSSAYADDAYAFDLDPVSLTVTPSSEANSTEDSGIRVDGYDLLTQPITDLTATEGTIKFAYTPRHSAGDVADFNQLPAIAEAYLDAANHINVQWIANNQLQLLVTSGGTTTNSSWTATGAIVAGTTYEFTIEYTPINATLAVDGDTKITIAPMGGIDFGSAPSLMYWGTKDTGANQVDATYSEPN